MGAIGAGIVGGIGSELSGGTFSQGMMLSAMNAVTIWAIEQSISSRVKTGTESEKPANTNMETNKGNEASGQTKLIDYDLYAMGPSANKIAGTIHKSSGIVESGEIILEGGSALYEGIRHEAQDDYSFYKSTGAHKYEGFKNINWDKIPGNTFDEKFKNLQR